MSDANQEIVKLQQEVLRLNQTVAELTSQLHYLYYRLQIPTNQYRSMVPNDGRTETGMGPILSPDKSSFV